MMEMIVQSGLLTAIEPVQCLLPSKALYALRQEHALGSRIHVDHPPYFIE